MLASAAVSSTQPPFVVIGNPENRRVTLFQAALARCGLPPAHVVAWQALLEAPQRLAELPRGPALLRLDAAGENSAVERGLLRLGYEAALGEGVHTITPRELDKLAPERGRILCPRQAQLGFERLLGAVAAICADRPDWALLNDPATVVELFDKRRTSQRYRAAGIPVPEALVHEGVAPTTPESLRAALRERDWRRVFVKLAGGSSASGLAVFRWREDHESLLTSIEQTPSGLYNSLKLRRYDQRAEIDRVLSFLLKEGAQIERVVPKARLEGALFDCRVLCVAGEPAFEVVRQSRHPITNLHLGGWRGDPDALARALPPGTRKAADASCRAVAALHGGTLQLGVDLLFEAGFRGHRIIEANAFGDLLPGLERDGLDVYAWQIVRAARWSADRRKAEATAPVLS